MTLDLSRHPWRVYRVGSDQPEAYFSGHKVAEDSAYTRTAITGVEHYVAEPEKVGGTQ